jgi:hypothetical protein
VQMYTITSWTGQHTPKNLPQGDRAGLSYAAHLTFLAVESLPKRGRPNLKLILTLFYCCDGLSKSNSKLGLLLAVPTLKPMYYVKCSNCSTKPGFKRIARFKSSHVLSSSLCTTFISHKGCSQIYSSQAEPSGSQSAIVRGELDHHRVNL